MCQVYNRELGVCVKYTIESWVFVCQVYSRELGVCVYTISIQ